MLEEIEMLGETERRRVGVRDVRRDRDIGRD